MTKSRRTLAKLQFYRDLFLMWPLLLSSLATGGLLFSHDPDDRSKGMKCALIAGLTLVLARRRVALALAVVAFLASRLVVSINRPADLRVNLAFYIVGFGLLWLIRASSESKSFRRIVRDHLNEFESDETTMTDLLVGLSGLLAIFVVFYYVFR